MTEPHVQADVEDVYQEEETDFPKVVVPVHVETVREPIKAQAMPAKRSNSRLIQVLNIEQILADDPRRKRVVFLAAVQGCFLGTDRTLVNAGQSFLLSVNVPLALEIQDAVFARTADNTLVNASALSIWVENWTD